jgi:2-amino-4-hydroxy-6-hydroxymethyldihydropteridine diphosphokinase
MNRRLAQGLDVEDAGDADGFAGVAAVIALGANLGDRAATLAAAAAELARLPLTAEVRVAAPISSVAVRLDGPDADAPAYLNTVALVSTRLSPSVLLSFLHAIEERHGRVRRERWGDRTLDLDLICYGEVTSSEPRLLLPHPRAAQRSFVLEPWLTLDPEAVLPGFGRVDVLAARLRETS